MNNITRNKNICIYIYSFFTILSCSTNKEREDPLLLFNKNYSISGETLNVSSNRLNSYGRMILFENNNCLIKENLRGENLLEKIFYEKDSIVPIGMKGNGPNEHLHLLLMQKENKESYRMIDILKSRIYKQDLSEFIIDTTILEHGALYSIHTPNGYVASSFIKEGTSRYSIYNYEGNQIGSFGSFPDDGTDSPVSNKQLAYQGIMAYNYVLNRMVSVSTSGIIMEIYQLDTPPYPVKLQYNVLPKYELANDGRLTSIRHKQDNIFGYIDIYATNKYIYTLYAGTNPAIYIKDNNLEKARRCKKILVYDWNGNPVCIFDTDKEVMNICVSEDDSYIIGLGWDNDYKLYRFDLPDIKGATSFRIRLNVVNLLLQEQKQHG